MEGSEVDDTQREIEGVEMALAGLLQALAWMPGDCCSRRSLAPLEDAMRDRISQLEDHAQRV